MFKSTFKIAGKMPRSTSLVRTKTKLDFSLFLAQVVYAGALQPWLEVWAVVQELSLWRWQDITAHRRLWKWLCTLSARMLLILLWGLWGWHRGGLRGRNRPAGVKMTHLKMRMEGSWMKQWQEGLKKRFKKSFGLPQTLQRSTASQQPVVVSRDLHTMPPPELVTRHLALNCCWWMKSCSILSAWQT